MRKYKGIIFLIIFLIVSLFISTFLFAEDTNTDEPCLDNVTGEDLCVVDPGNNSLFYPLDNNQEENINLADDTYIGAVYFTGIGCPHCAKIDPYLFKEFLPSNPNFVLIEYEVKTKKENAVFAVEYDNKYSSGFSIPILILDKDNVYYYTEIEDFLKNEYKDINQNNIPFPSSLYTDIDTSFKNINLNEIPGKPVIWKEDRALEKTSNNSEVDSDVLKNLLVDQNIDNILKDLNHTHKDEEYIAYSGGVVYFDNVIKLNGWNFYFNGDCVYLDENSNQCEYTEDAGNTKYGATETPNYNRLSLIKVISLALTDAVNPCAFAVLLMLLLAITTSNPENKKRILKSGLLFVLSVFIMYFLYGLIFVTIFKSISSSASIIFYKVFAILAIVLGVLQIRDYVNYRPGSIGTEMPMKLRPIVKRIISKITSPTGAFIIGFLVSLFLLPCTIGPYVIATNSLAFVDLFKSIPLLLLYNLIFVIPMLIITLIVYFGIRKIQDIGKWKERNIKYLHLIAGIIILFLGLLMLFGWL